MFMLMYHPWRIGLPLGVLVAVWAAGRYVGYPGPRTLGMARDIGLVWLLVAVVWQVLAWLSRLYVLTDRRLIVVAGIVARDVGDVPLARVQHATVVQSVLARVLGLGTIGIATAGSVGSAVNWLLIRDPQRTLAAVRRAVDSARGLSGADNSGPAPREAEVGAARGAPIPVIGLAGGIGAGKSHVAGILAKLGCVVIDSDAQARAALDQPEVRRELIDWWGEGILGPEGRVDRKAVAQIVFGDPEQRRRLESLVHPLVRASRAQAVALARDAGAPAAVVDAPLLFEAGVDAECDAVIFVDAPRDLRLKRVRARSGWDEAELARRESSQMSLEDKRARSDHLIENPGETGRGDDLEARVRSVLHDILRGGGRPAGV